MGGARALILPRALRPGDLVALAAPGSPFDRAAFLRGAEQIAARGYRVTYRDDIFARRGFLAGDDERRAAELDGWLRDPEVRAVLFARGGYGTSRIIGRLDLAALRRRPKIVAGFSDLTVLLLAVAQRAGVAAFHGPMVAAAGAEAEGARDLARLLELLERPAAPCTVRGLRALAPGRARAPLTGGNLTMLAHSIGTPFEVETDGRILFVEEVNEAPYQIDRALRQLLLAGKLRRIRGLVLGNLPGGRAAARRAVTRSFLEAVAGRAIPVVARFPAGHAGPNRAFPLGVAATLDAGAGTLTIAPGVRGER
jgi:muramoyltetrapeptide carboxypeptidase